MKLTKKLFFLVSPLILFFIKPVGAYDILTIQTAQSDQCSVFSTGMIIDIDADSSELFLLQLNGELKKINEDEISKILKYKTLENPIKKINYDPELFESLYEVESDELDKNLTGWNIRFFNDILFFYGVDGNEYILRKDSLKKISSASEEWVNQDINPSYSEYDFLLDREQEDCLGVDDTSDQVPAVLAYQYISDQIDIYNFLHSIKTEFLQFKNFASKAKFYPKPKLYLNQAIFRLHSVENKYTPEIDFPFSFYYDFGESFQVQNKFRVFRLKNDHLPILEHTFSLDTEVKAYFFRGGFSSNLFAGQRAARYMVQNAALLSSYFTKISEFQTFWTTSYSMNFFSGFDYGAYSYQVGSLNPIFGILGNNGYFREVSHPSSGTVISLEGNFKSSGFSAHVMTMSVGHDNTDDSHVEIGQIDELLSVQGSNNGPNNDDSALPNENEPQDYSSNLEKYSLDYSFFRFNYHFDWEGFTFSYSGLLDQKKYSETFLDVNGTFTGNTVAHSLGIEAFYGNKVTVGGSIEQYNNDFKFESDQNTSHETFQITTWSASFGFVL